MCIERFTAQVLALRLIWRGRAYSGAEVASLVGEIKKQENCYKDVASEEYKAALPKSGFPVEYVDLFVSFDLSIKHGDVALVSDAVREFSGEAPQDLRSVLVTALE